ncbi:MAG: hypothetical protein ACFB12_10490 [Leptolyngbyaceae cyanobacterium]
MSNNLNSYESVAEVSNARNWELKYPPMPTSGIAIAQAVYNTAMPAPTPLPKLGANQPVN